jgi:hypothetical protein
MTTVFSPFPLQKTVCQRYLGNPFDSLGGDGIVEVKGDTNMNDNGKTLSIEEQLFQAKKEVERWKSIAIYLLDCHAATAGYDGTIKSVSKSRKERFASILEEGIALFEGMKMPRQSPVWGDDKGPEARVLERSKNAIRDIRGS